MACPWNETQATLISRKSVWTSSPSLPVQRERVSGFMPLLPTPTSVSIDHVASVNAYELISCPNLGAYCPSSAYKSQTVEVLSDIGDSHAIGVILQQSPHRCARTSGRLWSTTILSLAHSTSVLAMPMQLLRLGGPPCSFHISTQLWTLHRNLDLNEPSFLSSDPGLFLRYSFNVLQKGPENLAGRHWITLLDFNQQNDTLLQPFLA